MPSQDSIHPPTTPRRSQRLLLLHQLQPYNPPTPYNNPSNPNPSKSNDSIKKLSNQKSAESRTKSKNCTTGLRRSTRLNNGVVDLPSLPRRSPRFCTLIVPVTEQNGVVEKPSRGEKFSGDSGNLSSGTRKSARVKGGKQAGGADEAKKKEYPVEHCEGLVVEEGKVRNGDVVEVGVKRKRKRKREKEAAKGWTKEQELALQRAYLAAMPSPHFWKNVSRLKVKHHAFTLKPLKADDPGVRLADILKQMYMVSLLHLDTALGWVPGKSQQECFDRIHRDHITPPQSQPRSRAKTITSSPLHQFSLSASKVLKPFDKKIKRSNFLKPKSYIAQKSVEKLLQGHLNVDRDREGDIFSVLEPNTDLSTNAFQPSEALSTPKQQKVKQGFLQNCTERSSSSHKKPLSRFSGSCITDLASPPVLKQVKNRVLHEKYIHQLRCREAKRKAASARTQVPITGKISEGSRIQKRDVVKAAKVALVSEARDAINKFEHAQVHFSDNCSSDEDNNVDIGVECESR
ncbi:hypothetical protein RIF29_36426 [Crotalaria pallida]|uniref:Uncharacterized protein n=1 Tax=Crotalaria pallida TaxID=3830 RepID=A0AAN9EB31_CROPI